MDEMMDDLRDEVARLAKNFQLADDQFRLAGPYEWSSILERITERFVAHPKPQELNWWWEHFKGSQYSVPLERNNAHQYLERLMGHQSAVWLVAEEFGTRHKRWLYESTVGTVQRILVELPFFEYYLVDRKLSWLLCENHHGALIAVGAAAVDRLKALTMELSSL